MWICYKWLTFFFQHYYSYSVVFLDNANFENILLSNRQSVIVQMVSSFYSKSMSLTFKTVTTNRNLIPGGDIDQLLMQIHD